MTKYFCTLIVLSIYGVVLCIPNRNELKDNPIENDLKTTKHYDAGHHNTQYDHEAFLGKNEAKEYDKYSPEESQRRLGIIVDKIDEDKDGFVTISELKRWIQYTQRRYIDEDVNRTWKQHNPEENDTISWDSYRDNVYGFMSGLDKDELDHEENGISYSKMLKRDRRRWGVADQDMDDKLNKEEFSAFLHPEDNPKMSEVVLTETIEDIDKNKDGKISIHEYIGDMYTASSDDEEEPEWVTSERESFKKLRDFDQNGYLDREEVRSWIVPKDFDNAESEAKHLVFEADEDSDEKLTKKEIIDKYDLFVGSQVTDFGEALDRHDEF